MSVQRVIRSESICGYACKALPAVLQRLKVYVLCNEAGICKNEIPATVDCICIAFQQDKMAGKLWKVTELLRSGICYSSKLIACHEAPYQVACVTLQK